MIKHAAVLIVLLFRSEAAVEAAESDMMLGLDIVEAAELCRYCGRGRERCRAT
jgi:hypothetical protein